MIRSIDDALALLEQQKLLPLTSVPPLKCLVDEVAGERVRGSWWGHKAGGAIFNIASELEDHEDVVAVKLLAGKVTFVHRALWPSLLRVVTDPEWRAKRERKLSAASRQVLSSGNGDKEIEKALLMLSRQEHTSSGKHVTVYEHWDAWAKRVKAKPAKGSVDDAIAELESCAQGATLSV